MKLAVAKPILETKWHNIPAIYFGTSDTHGLTLTPVAPFTNMV